MADIMSPHPRTDALPRGPWWTTGQTVHLLGTRAICVQTGMGRNTTNLAWILQNPGMTTNATRAVARLMAAAAEMHDLLEALLKEAVHSEEWSDITAEEHARLRARAQLLLAKIEGRS